MVVGAAVVVAAVVVVDDVVVDDVVVDDVLPLDAPPSMSLLHAASVMSASRASAWKLTVPSGSTA